MAAVVRSVRSVRCGRAGGRSLRLKSCVVRGSNGKSRAERPSSRGVMVESSAAHRQMSHAQNHSERRVVATRALGGGDRPQLKRENEPEDAWISKAEKEGKSPFQDPMALAFISAVVVPFVILGIAIGTGYVG